jgi:hypothetical protein
MSENRAEEQDAIGIPSLGVAERCAGCVLQCMLGEDFRGSAIKSQRIAAIESGMDEASARLRVFDDNMLPIVQTVFEGIVFKATDNVDQREELAYHRAAHASNQAVISFQSRKLSDGCEGPGEPILLSSGICIGYACTSEQRAFVPNLEMPVEQAAEEYIPNGPYL